MKKGILLALATAFISGAANYINKFSVKMINPYVFNGLKNVMVAVFLFSLILLFGQWRNLKNLKKKDWLVLVLIGLIGGSIPFLLFFKGLSLTSAVKGSFIHKTMFLYVAVLAIIFLKEKLNFRLFFGIIALLFGTALIIRITPQALNFGDLLVFLAVILWSVEQVISKQILKKLSSLTVAWARMFFGSIFILIFLIATNQFQLFYTLSVKQINWTLLTVVLLLFYLLTWYPALKRLPASVATSILALGAPATALLSLIFDQKLLTPLELTGLILVLAGAILVIDISSMLKNLKIKKYERPRD
jgi:drug/metabolite transporter (DMT)-like permease